MYYIEPPMTITVRLKAGEERALREAVRALGRSRSQVVREAIARYAERCLETSGTSAKERLEPWLGCVDGGGRDLSVATGRGFKALMGRHGHETGPR